MILVLRFGGVHFIEEQLGLESEGFQRRRLGKLRDFVFRQLGRVFIAAIFKEPPQQEILLHRFHVFLEGDDSYLGMVDGVTQTGGGLVS